MRYRLFSLLLFVFILFTVVGFRLVDISKDPKYNYLNKVQDISVEYNFPSIFTEDGKNIVYSDNKYDLVLNLDLINLKEVVAQELKRIIKTKPIEANRNLKYINISELEKEKIKKIFFSNRNLFFKKYKSKSGNEYRYFPDFRKKFKERVYTEDISIYQPLIGYINKFDVKNKNGVESWMLSNKSGKRVISEIKSQKGDLLKKRLLYEKGIFQREIFLSINSKIQKITNEIAKETKIKTGSKNVLILVAETKTGKMLSMSAANNYSPEKSKEKIENERTLFNNYKYEPGSTMKPISLLEAYNQEVISEEDLINCKNGFLKIGKHTIKDEHKFEYLTPEDIISHSSNVGISKIALLMDGKKYLNFLNELFLKRKIEIEIDNNLYTYIPKEVKKSLILNKKIQRANISYGYSISTTPLKMLEVYNMIANDGKYIPLSIMKNEKPKGIQIFKAKNVKKIKRALEKVVKEGTASSLKLGSLKVYGKTGTSHISKKGYQNKYNSSFIGFIEGSDGNKYTIMVLVIEPSWENRFASMSAVPAFEKVVKSLFKRNFIFFKPIKIKKEKEKEKVNSKDNKYNFKLEK